VSFLKIYLVGYFFLLLGATLTLWQSGMLDRIPGVWIALGLLVAVGLGIVLAASSPQKVTRASE
jgi:hypothetical protein